MANPLQEASGTYTISNAAAALEDVAGSLLGLDDEPEQDDPEEDTETAEDEAETVEAEADEAEAESADDEGAEDPDTTIELNNISDLAKALGVDEKSLADNLRIPVKVDGEIIEVTLAEAAAGHQMQASFTKKTQALAEERRALQAEREQSVTSMTAAAQEAAAALQVAEQLLFAEVNSPAMQQLRQTNPAEWTAKQHELQARHNYLQQARNQATQQFAQAMQAAQHTQQQQMARHLQEQDQMLAQKVDNWSTDKKQEVARFLSESYGWSPEDLSGVSDHRLILMALDAQRGRQAKESTEKVVQKVKALPKVQPPGKPKSAIQVKAKHIAGLKGQLRQTGKIKDAARVIEALL